MERLQEALQAGPDGQPELDAVRELIDRIVLSPVPSGDRFEVELIGDIASMISLALAETRSKPRSEASGPDLFARSIKVVAGTPNRRSHKLAVWI